MKHPKDIVQLFDPISLDEMDAVKLMNRTDTKFAFSQNFLPEILELIKSEYSVLEVNNNRVSSYKTLYFDTAEHQLFLDHHNGKPNRFKVRIRNYIESNLFFLEAKRKYKGRTLKSRIKLADFENRFSEKSMAFLQQKLNLKSTLNPSLWNSFDRITLVNKYQKERLTIDFNLAFENELGRKVVQNVVIIEVKQEHRNRSSIIFNALRKFGIRESGMSKYCLGTILMNKSIKYNNFKEKLLLINKITNAA